MHAIKNYFKILHLFFLIALPCVFAAEIRYLKPPNLDENSIGRKIICYRPMRKQEPNFSIGYQENKVLIHNYGHGGAGWSLGIGSVQYCCELLKQSTPDLEKSTPIAIVGSGCIGLFTAYHLWNMGYENITIYAEAFEDLTSHHAGGLLSFRAVYKDPSTNDLILKIGKNSYSFFRSIAEGRHPDFLKGASIMPTYFESLADSELEDLVGNGMEPAKDILVEFGNSIRRKMIAYDDSIFIDASAMMEQLHYYLRPKIKFKQQIVQRFNDLPENIIFNCSGLGSQELNQDTSLHPIQGHLIMLKNQNPKALQYMLIANFDLEKDMKEGICRTLDFFPKKLTNSDSNDIGVLGGTFIESCNELNTEEFDLIIERAKCFFYQDIEPPQKQ